MYSSDAKSKCFLMILINLHVAQTSLFHREGLPSVLMSSSTSLIIFHGFGRLRPCADVCL